MTLHRFNRQPSTCALHCAEGIKVSNLNCTGLTDASRLGLIDAIDSLNRSMLPEICAPVELMMPKIEHWVYVGVSSREFVFVN